MELQVLSADKIDRKKWDETIASDPHSTVFVFSWYLDVAAFNWAAIVSTDYSILLPFAFQKKFGITYIYQPFFTRNFGLYGNKNHSASALTLLGNLSTIYRYWDFSFDHNNIPAIPNLISTEKKFQVLDLSSGYDEISKKYSAKLRRSLRLASAEDVFIEPVIDLARFTSEFKKHTSSRISEFRREDYDRLQILLEKCCEKTETWSFGVKKKNEFISAVFFVKAGQNIIYIEGYSSPAGREMRAMHLLFDQVIKHYAGQKLHLDFGGSNVPTIAHFFHSFGAVDQTYLNIRLNNLPWPLRWLKK